MTSDFNGDGHADIAIGAPLRKEGSSTAAGAVQVANGSATGVKTTGSKTFDDSSFSQLTLEANDIFGSAVEAGNFNGDCYGDLAIAIPGGQPVDARRPAASALANGGAVAILYGSASGLTTAGDQVFLADNLDASVVPGALSLAAGDFNADGKTDLAIGMPFGAHGAGGVAVLSGATGGLTNSNHQFITQATTGVPGGSEAGDEFGFAVAAGDFTGDGFADLAIGAPGEGYSSIVAAGAVTVVKGSSGGLTGTGSKLWTEDTTGVPGVGEHQDGFGTVLAAGDITGDGKDDLAIGAPSEGIGGLSEAGDVTVLHGSSSAILTTSGAQLFDQNSTGIPGTAEALDMFGASLAMGDLDGDGHADLAIGDSEEAVGTLIEAGTVTVLHGRTSGLTTSGAKAWDQNSTGVIGASEMGDEFGNSLVALRIRSSSHADLVIGDPGESLGTHSVCGAVAILPGGLHGLTATGNQLIDPADLAGGAGNVAEAGRSVA